MKFSSFSEQVVPRTFTRGDQSVELQINIDAFTPEYFREVVKRLQPTQNKLKALGKKKTKKDEGEVTFETEAKVLEINREIFVDYLLPDVLKGWDLTEDDGETPVRLNTESMLRLPPRLVEELWDFCVAQSQTVKRQPTAATDESQMTVGNTEGGSLGLRVVGGQTT